MDELERLERQIAGAEKEIADQGKAFDELTARVNRIADKVFLEKAGITW